MELDVGQAHPPLYSLPLPSLLPLFTLLPTPTTLTSAAAHSHQDPHGLNPNLNCNPLLLLVLGLIHSAPILPATRLISIIITSPRLGILITVILPHRTSTTATEIGIGSEWKGLRRRLRVSHHLFLPCTVTETGTENANPTHHHNNRSDLLPRHRHSRILHHLSTPNLPPHPNAKENVTDPCLQIETAVLHLLLQQTTLLLRLPTRTQCMRIERGRDWRTKNSIIVRGNKNDNERGKGRGMVVVSEEMWDDREGRGSWL